MYIYLLCPLKNLETLLNQVDGTGSQGSGPNSSLCTADLSTIPSGIRTPPPSLVSGTGEGFSCVAVDNICIHINVPAPSETDVIARVSREALSQEEESDEYASGEEWEDERKSEYSTADEDFEPEHLRVEKMITFSKQPDIDEGEDVSLDIDVIDTARTDANRRDPCAPTFAGFGANSEALRPVIVRQVSEEEDVKVTSDDDDDRVGRPPEEDRSMLPQYIYCERVEMPSSLHDSATSPIPQPYRGRDDATEPVRWSEAQSLREEPEDWSSPRDEVDLTSRRHRSLPTLPATDSAAHCVPLSLQEIEHPTPRRSGRYSEPVPTTTQLPQVQRKQRILLFSFEK